MNPSSLAIILIIAISAAVFGGIVFFGLRAPAPVPTGGPVTTGTTVRVPDILNLPGFGGARTPQIPGAQPDGEKILETTRPDVVVQRNELPAPVLPTAVPSPRTPQTRIFVPPPSRVPSPARVPQTNVGIPAAPAPPVSLFSLPPQPAAASFSVFKASPQLRVFREQMIEEGIIGDGEFTRINNNKDAEAFMLKLVEWQARKASSTPEQIQDALNRITKAYDQF
jgi:hypothetical protein